MDSLDGSGLFASCCAINSVTMSLPLDVMRSSMAFANVSVLQPHYSTGSASQLSATASSGVIFLSRSCFTISAVIADIAPSAPVQKMRRLGEPAAAGAMPGRSREGAR